MDAYMKRLAEKEAAATQRDADSDEERRKRADPLLKETSFDRRKVVAVYTSDGRRGHHMSDFLPPEELAKFLAPQQKEALSLAQAAAPPLPGGALGADNIGHKLMQKMGWTEGQGLGGQSGKTQPAAVQQGGAPPPNGSSSGLGLGAAPHAAAEKGDDEFTLYRKRSECCHGVEGCFWHG